MLTETPMNPLSANRWTHWDPLKYYPCTVNHAQLLHRTFFYLFSSPIHSSVCILFCLPHFARVTSFKENWATEKWSLCLPHLERIAKHKSFLEILFTRMLTVVNFPCTDWLSGGSCIWEPSNLVPRVSHLTAPWSERRETLVGSGHLSPRIWEMTIKLLKGWAA